jgi:hypothetical protein
MSPNQIQEKPSKQGCVAVMQPYIFPYIGYFHLIEASSVFVFYDDVHHIKRGWINRNRILQANDAYLFSVPLSKPSQSRLINETILAIDKKWTSNFYAQLTHAYKKAPYLEDVMDLVTSIIEGQYKTIAELAIASVTGVYDYLGSSFDYLVSSTSFAQSRGISRADRLIQITKELGYRAYVNAPGGKELYSKEYFREQGIELSFIESKQIEYKQISGAFVPKLSIIDILMFNEKERIQDYFSAYSLV